MDKFISHTGVAAPLRSSNVDTDQICPAQFLKRVTRSGYEDALFYQWRKDESFVLNRLEFAAASILVAGPDFGTGSSREHAVWALRDYGFRAVISSRFADIFKGNAGKGGLITAQVDQEVVERLWAILEADPNAQVTVDLNRTSILAPGVEARFDIDEYVRWRLMEGLDDVGITLQYAEEIVRFEAARPSFSPATK